MFTGILYTHICYALGGSEMPNGQNLRPIAVSLSYCSSRSNAGRRGLAAGWEVEEPRWERQKGDSATTAGRPRTAPESVLTAPVACVASGAMNRRLAHFAQRLPRTSAVSSLLGSSRRRVLTHLLRTLSSSRGSVVSGWRWMRWVGAACSLPSWIASHENRMLPIMVVKILPETSLPSAQVRSHHTTC